MPTGFSSPSSMSTATKFEFAELEREARERFGKPQELVASYPAEVKAIVKKVFREGLQ